MMAWLVMKLDSDLARRIFTFQERQTNKIFFIGQKINLGKFAHTFLQRFKGICAEATEITDPRELLQCLYGYMV